MSAKNNQTLKHLNTRKAKLEVDVAQLLTDQIAAQDKYRKAKEQLKDLCAEVSRALEGEASVSEHAIIRYLERVNGLNLDTIREAILSPAMKKAIDSMGSGKYPIGNGCRAVVKGKTVVSVI